jgi:chemotaxis protein methyltransferase CheR
MTPADFSTLAQIVKQHSGLVLTPEKSYLLEARLAPVARQWNLATVEELASRLRMRPDDALIRAVNEAMTTNETFFFRDTKPFDLLRNIMLPQVIAARGMKRSLRIWSAASSAGQEAYSIAMLLHERAAELGSWRIEIVGTDLSNEMVTRARAGVYSQFEVQRGLPAKYLIKYFKQAPGGWQISDTLKQMVQFKTLNLLGSLSSLGQFDIVFCRNVLIYFDLPTKSRVLQAIAAQTASDGFLVLGGAETILGVSDRFRAVEGSQGLFTPQAAALMKQPA